jgi:hypothetical protein
MVDNATIGYSLLFQEMGLEPNFDILPYEKDFMCWRMGYFNAYILPHSS